MDKVADVCGLPPVYTCKSVPLLSSRERADGSERGKQWERFGGCEAQDTHSGRSAILDREGHRLQVESGKVSMPSQLTGAICYRGHSEIETENATDEYEESEIETESSIGTR